jgi:hypothetical protein
MTAITSLFSAEGMRRFFGQDNALLERRVLDLPVMVERRAARVPVLLDRRGPRCTVCEIGTMRAVAADEPGAGGLRCSSPNCSHVQDAA